MDHQRIATGFRRLAILAAAGAAVLVIALIVANLLTHGTAGAPALAILIFTAGAASIASALAWIFVRLIAWVAAGFLAPRFPPAGKN